MTYPVPSPALRRSLEAATAEYQSQLAGSPGEPVLLARGLTPKIIEYFRLGYVSSPISGDESFRGRISVPYLTQSGVVSSVYKALGDSPNKVLVHTGTAKRPYGVRALTSTKPILIVEGEPDVWAAAVCGLPAVGIPGATNWQYTWRRIFRRHDLIVVADGDEAGTAMVERVMKDVVPVARTARLVTSPPKEDLNSMLIKHGVDGVKEWLNVE